MSTVFYKISLFSNNPENEPVTAIHDAIKIAKATGSGVWVTWSDGRTSLVTDCEDPARQVDRYWRERMKTEEKK